MGFLEIEEQGEKIEWWVLWWFFARWTSQRKQQSNPVIFAETEKSKGGILHKIQVARERNPSEGDPQNDTRDQ